jgi:3-oxoacyl-(acyl-carrier-protein) synthase
VRLPPARDEQEPIVITGIGMIASVGNDRESVWQAVQRGQSGVRSLRGLQGIPDDLLIAATVDIPPRHPGELKTISLMHHAAAEAMADSHVRMNDIDRDRFACAISGHMGDTGFVVESLGRHDLIDPQAVPWWQQWLPNTGCSTVANRFGLNGPRICHSTACASGLIDILAAVRAIEDDKADIALAGSAEGIHPLFAAGFHRMGVLAEHEDPTQACRPFDVRRSGFVMGEGSAMFVIERLSHAIARGAKIYAEITAGRVLAEAHHVTGLDASSEALAYLISATLNDARLAPHEINYINAHGTGTQQNDLVETRGIRRALGAAADNIWVSATKSMLGHLVNASGSVELAITTMALRDGFVPPTLNLTDPDPQCDLDCIPLVGRPSRFQTALKLSVAFGGHLAAITLRRWDDIKTGFGYPPRLAA